MKYSNLSRTQNRITLEYRRFLSKSVLRQKNFILNYHRVANNFWDPNYTTVSVDNFKRQIDYLDQNFEIVSIGHMCNLIKNKSPFHNKVCITFDDGYRSTQENAINWLASQKIPSTTYLTTALIDSSQYYWWDCLTEKLNINGPKSENLQQYRELAKEIRTATPDHRTALYSKNVKQEDSRFTAVSVDEIKDIATNPYITIGAHSVNHYSLAHQTIGIQQTEIAVSKRALEDIINKAVTHFAYPYGSRNFDYNKDTIELLKLNNFESSVITNHGRISSKSNLFELFRFGVREQELNSFIDFINEI